MSNWRLGQYFLLWCGCVGLGLWALFNYALTAPFPADAAPSWPAATALSRDNAHPTLLMFLHPNCPCSRASIAELSRLLLRAGDRLAVRVVFVRPDGLQPAAEEKTLVQLAAEIPGAVVAWDEDGIEAERFGVKTSGETLLYSSEGRLLFQGGLTSARGHEGDSVGQNAVMAILEAGHADVSRTPVFGCALLNPSQSRDD